ncbi:MAG: flagellar biosynthesis regulator FlaF [Pseudomonadota bacterium]
MPGKAIDAYKSVQNETQNGRELESSLLNKAALLLQICRDQWDAEGHVERFDDALRYNQRLWTFFQAELLEESNPLPAPLRQDLLNLSAFVDKRTFEVLAYPAKEKLDVLININRQIAEGLAATQSAPPPEEPALP